MYPAMPQCHCFQLSFLQCWCAHLATAELVWLWLCRCVPGSCPGCGCAGVCQAPVPCSFQLAVLSLTGAAIEWLAAFVYLSHCTLWEVFILSLGGEDVLKNRISGDAGWEIWEEAKHGAGVLSFPCTEPLDICMCVVQSWAA